MVACAHTVVDPRAVVVVPFDALATYAAVTTAQRLDGLALRTQAARVDLLCQILPRMCGMRRTTKLGFGRLYT